MRRLLTAALIATLFGCQTAQQEANQAAREQAEAEQAQAAYTRNLKAQCESIGYKQNTDPWRECIMKLHAQAQAQNAALRNVIIQQYMQNQPQPRQPATTNCTRDYFGNVKCVTR